MLPEYYEFINTVKINAGTEALETIPYELSLMQANRPIIITDKGIVNAGLLKIVLDSFADSELVVGVVFDQTPSDSSLDVVNAVARMYKENKCDSIIALGGGSVIDTAKGVNIIISEDTDDIRKFQGVDRLTKPQKPFVVIPTTSGTGSEVTLVAVISDIENNVKLPFTSNLLLPKLAVLDPRMTISLPPKITAATGIDALTHSIEAYTCLQKNPLSDAYALASINLIRENLVEAVKNGKNKQARFAMANASLMAGIAFSNSMVGAVHAIGHACGAIAHIHHGLAMSILLPYVMQYNFDSVKEYYSELLLALAGEDVYVATPSEKRAEKSIETIFDLRKQMKSICSMPETLSEAGVREEDLDQIAKTAINDGAMSPNPKDLNLDDVIKILKKAF
jgi:alcohol dehydrogenase